MDPVTPPGQKWKETVSCWTGEFSFDTIRITSFVFLSWRKLPVYFKIFTEALELFSHIRSQKLQLCPGL